MQRCFQSADQLRQLVGEEMGNNYDCIRFSPYPVLNPLTEMNLHAPSKYLRAALCKYHLVLQAFEAFNIVKLWHVKKRPTEVKS
jgi:hypothetical protein